MMRVKEESERASLKLNIKKKKLRSCYLTPLLHANRGGKVEVLTDFLFLSLKSLQTVTAAMKSEDVCFLARKL